MSTGSLSRTRRTWPAPPGTVSKTIRELLLSGAVAESPVHVADRDADCWHRCEQSVERAAGLLRGGWEGQAEFQDIGQVLVAEVAVAEKSAAFSLRVRAEVGFCCAAGGDCGLPVAA